VLFVDGKGGRLFLLAYNDKNQPAPFYLVPIHPDNVAVGISFDAFTDKSQFIRYNQFVGSQVQSNDGKDNKP
jgi:hypothetical protein